MLFVYNLLLYIYFIILMPFYIYKICTSLKYRVGLWQRLGFIPKTNSGKKILVHAVSVGEFLASLPLIKLLGKKYPGHEIIVSTTTLTGNRIARKKLEGSNRVVFFPLDFRWSVKRFLNIISPEIVILIETELWPNFTKVAKDRNIPVIVVNGRISDKSYKNYHRFRETFKNFFDSINLWGVQFERDKSRLTELGINNRNIYVTGSVKFDSAIEHIKNLGDLSQLKKQWKVSNNCRVLVGGSTHSGEEAILLNIYKKISAEINDLKLILVPRHPERKEEIEREIKGLSLNYQLRSKWIAGNEVSDYNVLLVDTIGELMPIYSFASVVFIGKSIIKGGGQNPIEPAGLGKAVICGPRMDNFSDITSWLLDNNALVQVKDEANLEEQIVYLLNNPNKREEIGNKARDLVYSADGAVKRNLDLIGKIL